MTTMKIRKAISRAFARLVFDRRAAPALLSTPRHVLVLRWDGKFGDAFVSSFFYRELRKAGTTKVSVVTTTELAEIHSSVFGADQVIISRPRPGLRELIVLRRRLVGIDAVVHLVGRIQPSEIFFLWLLKPQHVFSLDDELGWVNVKMGQTTEGRSFSEKYTYVLDRLGVKDIRDDYIIPMPATNPPGAANTTNCDIVFNPFASRPDKSLSAIKAVETLRCLAEALPDRRIGILSSPDTRGMSRHLAKRVARDNVVALDRIETILDAIAAVRATQAIVSVDTAIVHIAAGLARKLVAIYPFMNGEYNPWLPPTSPLTRIIYSYQNVAHYRLTGLKDMNSFEALDLIERVNELLKNTTSTDHDLVIEARVVSGIGAATRNLALQLPLISQTFPEVAGCHPGTINLLLGQPLTVIRPDHRTAPLAWVPDRQCTEVFDFVRIGLELPHLSAPVPAWLYVAHRSPHRRTPAIHEVITTRMDLAGVTNCRVRISPAAVAFSTDITQSVAAQGALRHQPEDWQRAMSVLASDSQ